MGRWYQAGCVQRNQEAHATGYNQFVFNFTTCLLKAIQTTGIKTRSNPKTWGIVTASPHNRMSIMYAIAYDLLLVVNPATDKSASVAGAGIRIIP